MRIVFDESAFNEYISWQTEDKKTLKRINRLIQSINRDGYLKGAGKPERLKNRREYSRRIDEVNRLIYIGDDEHNVIILSCKGHYED